MSRVLRELAGWADQYKVLLVAVVGAITTIVTIRADVQLALGMMSRHDHRLDSHESSIYELRTGLAVIQSKLHGVSTKLGQVPAKVASHLGPQTAPEQQ
jgi:hypothetical protein